MNEQNKNLKIIVVSTKGGVGKSTISMQLVAPYLYQKNANCSIKYYECDDTNRDINSYGATSIIQRSLISTASPMLREELFNVCSQPESLCIDIGGNNTAKIILDALDESGAMHFIDVVLIPALDGEQDMINAIDTYNYVKSINKNIKIIFVLNKVKEPAYVKEQFDHFFGDSRGVFSNFYSAHNYITQEELELFITFSQNDVIRFSRRFGLSVFEIAKIKKEYLDDILHNSNPKVASFKHFMSRSTQKYHDDILEKSFTIIDRKLGVPHA
jgi:hypothetical protein